MRVRRIGSVTCGLTLIAAGISFVICNILNSYEVLEWILRLWPLVIISLGTEMLFAQRSKEDIEIKHDFLGVVMTFFCLAFVLACEIVRLQLYANGYFG